MQKTRFQKHYDAVVIEDLVLVCNCRNIMQLPRMNRAMVSSTYSCRTSVKEKQDILSMFVTCFLLAGQKAIRTRALYSIAAFKLRQGSVLGCKVTLRRGKMYAIFDKTLTFMLPLLKREEAAEQEVSTLFSAHRAKLEVLLSDGVQGGTQLFKKSTTSRRHNVRDAAIGVRNATFLPEVEKLFQGFNQIQGFNALFSFSSCMSKQKQLSLGCITNSSSPTTSFLFGCLFLSAFQIPKAALSNKSLTQHPL